MVAPVLAGGDVERMVTAAGIGEGCLRLGGVPIVAVYGFLCLDTASVSVGVSKVCRGVRREYLITGLFTGHHVNICLNVKYVEVFSHFKSIILSLAFVLFHHATQDQCIDEKNAGNIFSLVTV